MNRLATAVAVAALTAGAVLTAPSATAASTPHDTTVYTQPAPIPAEAKVEQLDCRGTTGDMGCGPGWLARRLARLGVLRVLTMTIYMRTACAFAATAMAATIGGFASAAAQSSDYSTLPVDPNLITDSLAYSAAPLISTRTDNRASRLYTPTARAARGRSPRLS